MSIQRNPRESGESDKGALVLEDSINQPSRVYQGERRN